MRKRPGGGVLPPPSPSATQAAQAASRLPCCVFTLQAAVTQRCWWLRSLLTIFLVLIYLTGHPLLEYIKVTECIDLDGCSNIKGD